MTRHTSCNVALACELNEDSTCTNQSRRQCIGGSKAEWQGPAPQLREPLHGSAGREGRMTGACSPCMKLQPARRLVPVLGGYLLQLRSRPALRCADTLSVRRAVRMPYRAEPYRADGKIVPG
jgi:hypothetical protein